MTQPVGGITHNTHRRSKMKGNMNAYEIRTKIIKMAKEQVNEEYYQRKDRWLDSLPVKDKTDLHINGCPTPPTVSDILDVANKLYEFVKSQ
jgi:coenzyme F420-reducing hydrogenase gamma subunit